MEKITSTDIKIALSKIHTDGKKLFMTEVKNGSTYNPPPQGLLIMDAVAITKSYTKPRIVGYEVKVSRSDFLQDNKWHLYLQYCNQFYFVVPKGLIKKEELPEGVGMYWYYPDTGTVKQVKKALYRKIDAPLEMFQYMVYSRLDEERTPFYNKRSEYVKSYLEHKESKKVAGSMLGSKLAEELEECQSRLERLSKSDEELKHWGKIRKILEKHNIVSPWSWRDEYIEELDKALTSSYPKEFENVKTNLEYSLRLIKEIEEKYQKASEEE